MTNPYRALCAELVDELEHTEDWPTRDALLARARALLAQPVAEGPTNKELLECAAKALGYGWISSYDTCQIVEAGDLVSFARAALAKWSHPTPPPPADGEVAVNLRMDLSSECLKRLCDGLAAAVIPNGGYRELTTDDDISGEFIGEQQVSVTWWLPEHGCDSLENTLDAIKGRLCAAVRDWLPTAVTATPQPEPAPVAVSERLPGAEDCIKRGNDHWCWGQERSLLTGQASARWRLMRVSALTDEAVNWLPANALPIPESTVHD